MLNVGASLFFIRPCFNETPYFFVLKRKSQSFSASTGLKGPFQPDRNSTDRSRIKYKFPNSVLAFHPHKRWHTAKFQPPGLHISGCRVKYFMDIISYVNLCSAWKIGIENQPHWPFQILPQTLQVNLDGVNTNSLAL